MSSGGKLTEFISLGNLGEYPLAEIRAALALSGKPSERVPLLPTEVMVDFLIALGLLGPFQPARCCRCCPRDWAGQGLRLHTIPLLAKLLSRPSVASGRTFWARGSACSHKQLHRRFTAHPLPPIWWVALDRVMLLLHFK